MKIELTPEDENAIATLVATKGAGVEALKRLFSAGIADLRDVMTLDPKGNLGLQSLAAQRAVSVVEAIQAKIFPDMGYTVPGTGKKGISQFR